VAFAALLKENVWTNRPTFVHIFTETVNENSQVFIEVNQVGL